MIQRIQTLWLLFAAVCAGLTFKFTIYNYPIVGGDQQRALSAQLNAYYPTFGLVGIITMVIIILSLICIFMFKTRGSQLFFTIINFFVSLGLIYLYYYRINEITNSKEGNLSIWSVLLILIPIFIFLAIRGIIHDMRLLRKANRLRD